MIKRPLLRIANIKQARHISLGEVGGNDAGGVTDQMHIHAALSPSQVKPIQHMVGHVFHIPMLFSVRRAARTAPRHDLCIAFMHGKDIGSHRVVEPCLCQIGGVEWLVPNRAIGARPKGIHHRSRKVAWPRPHGNFCHSILCLDQSCLYKARGCAWSGAPNCLCR